MSRIADLMLEAGRARAAGYLGAGQAWGQGLVRIGDLLGRGVEQYAQLQRDEPMRQAALKNAEQQNTIGAMQIASAQKAAQDQAILGSAQGSGLDPETIKAQLQQLGRGDLIPIYEKTHADLETARLGLKKAKDEAGAREADYFGALAAGVKRANYDPIAVTWALDQADADGHDTKALRAQIQQRPELVKPIIEQLISRSPKQIEIAQKESELATKNAAENRMAKVAEAQAANTTADNARADAVAEETRRHNRVMEARPVAGHGGGAASYTPEGLEYAATRARITGQYPSRDSKTNAAIDNEIAKQIKLLGKTPAASLQKQAAYKADGAALQQITKMAAAAESYESKALAQADLVEQRSKQVGRTDFPFINGVLLSGKAALGDTPTHLFANALLTFTTEYAKVMAGATGSAAASTDSARHEAAQFISTALAKGTITETIKQMKWEMRQTMLGYDATIEHITDRMSGTPQPAAAPPTTAPPAPPPRVNPFRK